MPNIDLTREKTRSLAAELGTMEKMMRAALAHVGKGGLLMRHHLSSPIEYSAGSVRLKPPHEAAATR